MTPKYNQPEDLVNKIAIMIALQNLFRNGFVDLKEIGVWEKGRFIQEDDEKVENAVAREIFKLWYGKVNGLTGDEKAIALSAVATCALSHDRGHDHHLGHSNLQESQLAKVSDAKEGAGRNDDQGHDRHKAGYSRKEFLDKCSKIATFFNRVKGKRDKSKYTPGNAILCNFEFAHYLFSKKQTVEFSEFAQKTLRNCDFTQESMIILSFGRFWSNREIQEFHRLRMEKIGYFFDKDSNDMRRLLGEGNLDADHIQYGHLHLTPEDRFKLFLSEEDYSGGDVWAHISIAIKWIKDRRPWQYDGADYLPFTALNRVLHVLQKIHPKDFITGHITWSQSNLLNHGCTISLPYKYGRVKNRLEECLKTLENLKTLTEEETNTLKLQYKDIEEKQKKKNLPPWKNLSLEDCKNLIKEEIYAEPEMVIARYAAVAILNQRMAYGPGLLNIAFDADPEIAKGWYDIIRKVEDINRHDTLKYYLDLVSCPFHAELATTASKPSIDIKENQKEWQALCVDVGASYIKVELWNVSFVKNDELRLERIRNHCSYRTSPSPPNLYTDGEAFASRLLGQVIERFVEKEEKKEKKFDKNRLLFIGVGWPGPISGKPGNEYVSGPSGILRTFKETTNQILDSQPSKIHNLRIKEGFEDVFRSHCGQPVVVRLINDGEAHTRASLEQFKEKQEGCKATLTAGTGTALGVIPRGETTPAPI